ncbi:MULTISPECIES: ABC transporter permease [Agrobacterium]|uniref:Cell division transport system permease protein n=1 Tax=Agrobacterium larrymoorei TaxID=160699 RepID=A0AAJ2EQI5_9HYPH|nr:ABC transporter permease [Agrobacterium larrymoorei]MDQ1183625.1 cell division transport system permease protein [Agrobacterium larrymoorei]MDQ1195534.1 cell division transport system permease protein [Rhizobium sp. SORGH_AS_0787]MDR6101096.1 cell division transport system permease protein [Agrobacterium larrymoorei]
MNEMNRKTLKPRAPQQGAPQMRIRPMAPILPPSNIQGNALIVVIAIMAFLACLTLGAVSMVRATAASWQSQISREITIQIKPEDGLDMNAALNKARNLALGFVGTREGTIMDDAATSRLLEPWLGSGLDLSELPVPRLVIITIDENNPPDFEAMRAMLKTEIPQAFLDDHRTWVDRLVSMAHTTVMIGVGVLVLVFTAMVLTVIFATRGALSGNRHIVEVLHFVGAESGFVAREFQKHFLKISLKGSGAGSAVAALVFVAAGFWQSRSLATPQSDQATALFGSFSVGIDGYLGILATMIIISLLTTITARMTVIRTIDEIDRIRSDPSKSDGL